jgi:hypothetical protein
MLLQLAFGSALILATVLFAGLMAWGLESLLAAAHDWLLREPHRPRMALLLSLAAVWSLATLTSAVWIWATALWLIDAFPTLEESVYFALVCFTTLGFGDILLPVEWRLLGGLAAANGFMIFGLMVAMLAEVLRHIRMRQIESLAEED